MDARGIEVRETIPASRKLGKRDAAVMVKEASKLIVVKGKKVDEWKPAGRADSAAVAAMLGPTGNLRAPTIRVGKTMVVGFSDEVYSELFG